MSFNESVSDLNSKEFRSPPSARHCRRKQKCSHKNWQSFNTMYCMGEAMLCKLFTLICSNIAVSLEIRSVKFSLSTQSCPVDKVFVCLTTSWASSSHLRLRSVGWSAGWRPWSGASYRDMKRRNYLHILTNTQIICIWWICETKWFQRQFVCV